MSAKPNISLARWANLGGSFVTDAPSGLRDTGFLDATPAAADIVNGELKQLYLWALYLSDGALSGAHSIDNTLSVAGNLTVTADEILSGAITIGGQPLSFTDFVFTASSSTDLLTDTAHPLHTGAGPIRVSNSGGALPGGLSAGVDYWAIKVDVNTFKLATSFANAIANVAIDLTSNGTGTQTLLHQTGTTRATDATVSRTLTVNGNASVAGASTLASATVTGNATVGGTLGVTGVLTPSGGIAVPAGQAVTLNGSATLTVGTGAVTFGGSVSLAGNITVGGGIAHGDRIKLLGGGNAVASNSSIARSTPDNISTTGSTVLMWNFGLLSGDRPKSVSFTATGDGAVDITTVSLDIVALDDSVTTLVSGSFNNIASTVTNFPFTISSPVALGISDRVVLKLIVNAAGLSVGTVRITYDHPTP